MKKYTAVFAALAALPLAACGGAQETANTVTTENVVDEGVLNDSAASEVGLDNATFGNDLTIDNGFDNAEAAAGNDLTAVDNSQ